MVVSIVSRYRRPLWAQDVSCRYRRRSVSIEDASVGIGGPSVVRGGPSVGTERLSIAMGGPSVC